MRICRLDARELLASERKVIGFYGAPPRGALEDAHRRFPDAAFVDLDVFMDAPKTGAVADAYCHIIRNCVDNALMLRDRLLTVVAATGPEKCDAGRFAAHILADLLPVEVVSTVNEEAGRDCGPLLCEAKGSLKARAIRIMESLIEPLADDEIARAKASRCEPTHGFWGTPPHPVEMLDLFPPTTRIFGWTRCVEQGRPADLELEMTVDKGLPTVFFVQGFCAKAILARGLAKEHRGMLVDVHASLGAATMAKIEAFIRLSGRLR